MSIANQMRGVTDKHGHIARAGQFLREDRLLCREGCPAAKGEGELARERVGAHRQGGERARIGAVEYRRLLGEPVDVRRGGPF